MHQQKSIEITILGTLLIAVLSALIMQHSDSCGARGDFQCNRAGRNLLRLEDGVVTRTLHDYGGLFIHQSMPHAALLLVVNSVQGASTNTGVSPYFVYRIKR